MILDRVAAAIKLIGVHGGFLLVIFVLMLVALDVFHSGGWAECVLIVGIILVVGAIYYAVLLLSVENIPKFIGRWQLLAEPDRIVLRHSYYLFAVSRVVEPQAVASDGLRCRLKSDRPGKASGAEPSTTYLLGLSQDDARWLAAALEALYPGLKIGR